MVHHKLKIVFKTPFWLSILNLSRFFKEKQLGVKFRRSFWVELKNFQKEASCARELNENFYVATYYEAPDAIPLLE